MGSAIISSMSLSIGIVGLPNSGKSTLFNALLKRQIAQVGEYPYTTIEPNVGVVEVPDERLDKISEISGITKKVPAGIKFIDIAGLIKNAHKGEGLGNKFLGHIREVDAIVHIVRAFDSSASSGQAIPHVMSNIDPVRDIEVVNLELELAGIKKPAIYVLNVSESDLKRDFNLPFEYIKISAKLEAELSDLSEKEQKEYLKELGVSESALDQIILVSYKLLDLITLFTIAGGRQIQAWPIKKGTKATGAAEMVHTEFEKKFIKAEVVSFEDFVSNNGWKGSREKGKTRIEGREYIVKDGDIMEFKI